MLLDRLCTGMMTKSAFQLHLLFIIVILLSLISSAAATDQQSLLAFKQSIQDPTGVLSNWNSSSNFPTCNWTGVKCNQISRVTNLTLHSYQLQGSISSAIGGLSFLENLDLHNNSFSGSVPSEIGNCSNLKVVKLSSNLLTGDIPVTVGNLKLLQTLDLSHNKLDGVIPASLGNCTNLFFLTLTSNVLTGSIPSSLGNLVLLQGLLIGSNLFNGSFPNALFNLTGKLTEVILSDNQFTGSLPDKFDGFQALITLDLSQNNFTGDIPNTLGLSKALLSLNLAHNAFSGSLPLSLGSIPGTFAIALNLSDNFMIGSIGVLGNLSTTVSIDISKNQFRGGIESLTSCSYLTTLEISENSFSGELPGGLARVGWQLLNVSVNYLTGSVDGFTKLSPNLTSASFLPGNPGLCGLILDKPCIAASPSPTPTARAGGNGNHQATVRLRIILYAGGAVIVFGVFVILASWLDSARVRSNRHLRDCVTSYGRGLQIIRLNVKDVLTATDGFNQKHVIGHGGTSTVYKGLLPFYPFIIAVKQFKDKEDGRQHLLKEAGIMSILRHRNVVGTLGIASVPRSINVLVLEYIANGTLNQHLHGSQVCELNWEVRLKIAIDVATAISYLHNEIDEHLTIIHGDLKPANIFLESDFTAKVGDFGLAKLLVDDHRCDDHRWEGTFGYSPPGDVYSFGIVILEMVTRRRPASFAFEDLGGSFLYWVRAAFPDRLNEIVDPSLKIAEDFSFKKDAIGLFVRVGLLCTRDNPRERPTMREALEMIKTTEINSAAEVAVPDVPIRSIDELIDQQSYTSFQHAKTWGWINNDFILDSLDSALYHDSWISLFKLDMRDSRTLRAMGFDSFAISDIRRQTEERRKAKHKAATPSWMRSVWRALFHRKAFRRVDPRESA